METLNTYEGNKININVLTLPGSLTMNFDEMKTKAKRLAASYEIITYDEDQDKQQKQLREIKSEIKGYIDTLVGYKKSEEEKYLAPLLEYKSQIDEMIDFFEKPMLTITTKQTEFRNTARDNKRKAIRAFYDTLCESYPNLTDFKETLYTKLYNDKWENVGTAQKEYKDFLKLSVANYVDGLATIKIHSNDYVEETISEFKKTLSLQDALTFMNKKVAQQEEILRKERKRIEREEKARIEREQEEKTRQAIAESLREAEKAVSSMISTPVSEQVISTTMGSYTNKSSVKKSPVENIFDGFEELPMDLDGFPFSSEIPKEIPQEKFISISVSEKDFSAISAYCEMMEFKITIN